VRLAEVFRAPIASVRADPEPAETVVPPATRRGGVIALTTAQRLRKLLSTERGRLDPKEQPWPESLADLAERHSARWAAELHTGALDELMERVGDRMRREHDTLTQIILFTNVFRELEAEGKISVYPMRPKSWPVPREKVVLRAFDALCPNQKSMLLGVFDQGEVFTAILARRNGSGFDLILGPEKLRSEMGLISGDWRRDYRHLTRAAEAEAGELALGCFGELETLKQLVDSPAPGAWAAAVASRDIILSPAVPAVAIPLGIDVGRAAFVAVRGLAERMGAGAWLSADGPIAPALGKLRELTGVEGDVTHLIGFDPIAILKKLFSRERE
jgi:hypothetical protein